MSKASNPEVLLSLWRKLKPLPGRERIFNFCLRWLVPYSSSIGARIIEFEPGRATVSLADRHCVRNHLNSIHAIALANLCELTSGLAFISSLPPRMRGILKGFQLDYVKKARGNLLATCEAPKIVEGQQADVIVKVEARNTDGDVVVRAEALWRIGPRK